MKLKLVLESLVLALVMSACGPNDFMSTRNTTAQEEVLRAKSGIHVYIKNSIPEIAAVNGVPSVIHLNGQICSWSDSPRSKSKASTAPGQDQEDLPPLSECYTFNGTIHSGEEESFLIPASTMDRIY